jgi:hypothetical protein
MKQRHSLSAQALLEFALVIPLILFLLMLFFDIGRAVYYNVTLSNAVREGARYASVNPYPETDIIDRVSNYSIAVQGVTVTVNYSDIHEPPELSYISVTGDLVFTPVTPGLTLLLGSPGVINLSSESKMQLTPWGYFTIP